MPIPLNALASDAALPATARWLWCASATGPNTYVEFLCTLNLADLPKSAILHLSAETSLRLYINDRLIYSGPPREVPPYFYFDTLDLCPHLAPGRNDVRIIAHHQGQNSASYQAGTPAILLAGECITDNGTIHFDAPATWRCRPITRFRPDAPRLFSCLGFSEHVDFSAAQAPWQTPVEIARHPWPERPRALPRDLPLFTESIRQPVSLLPHAGGHLADFGGEVFGTVELQVRTPRALTLRVAYAEELVRGRVASDKQGLSYFDTLELPPGETSWRSYDKRAFRYLRLSDPLDVLSLRVVEQTYPYTRRDPADATRLEKEIRDVSARTIAINTDDLLTDCPWRERAQYFDCLFYMGAMHELFGTVEPIRRFLRQFPRGADATGLLRMCYPSPQSTLVIPDFSISYALLLHRFYKLTGDLPTIRQNLAIAERGITALAPHESAAGLLTNVPGWIFIDNTFELPKFPTSAALSAIYHGGHRTLAELFRLCDQPDRAAAYDGKAAKIRTAFRQAFVQKDRILDCDSTLDHERYHHWNYHFAADADTWSGNSFRLRLTYRLRDAQTPLRLAVHEGARAWIDGQPVADIKQGGSWIRSAIYQPQTLPTPQDTRHHRLDLQIQWSDIDWECYLSCLGDVEWSAAIAWPEADFGRCDPNAPPPPTAFATRLRHHQLPWMTQATVGHAAFHGLLDPDEAPRFLAACLPARYHFPFAKKTTPFFAAIDDAPDPRRILPCNVPASMFYFCHALALYGMKDKARDLLLPIYRGMLARGATTWWEEWNTRSSHCHAWTSFGVEFMDASVGGWR